MVHTNQDGSLTGYATCPQCKTKKPLSDFYKKKTNKYGYKHTCKACEKIFRKEYYSGNKEKEDLNHSKYISKNKDSVNKRRNERYSENHDQKRIVANTYIKNKTSDPKERVYFFALKYIGKHKKSSSKPVDLLGCNAELFSDHLENHFQKNMSWSNYGIGKNKWSMDHKKPINSFNLFDDNQEKTCFNYSNIQPMWFNDNASKKDKI